jgi:uridine phosphorylase
MDYQTPRHPVEESVFTARNLLSEARRHRGLPAGEVPEICLLDPDGDFVRELQRDGKSTLSPTWACYHTQLWQTEIAGSTLGVVGMAVGAPFAVLIAEQLFASGCRLLLSISSAGQLAPLGTPPYFVFIDRALRDEGTSGHYQPEAPWSRFHPSLDALVTQTIQKMPFPVYRGASWTTDAPFRETLSAIKAAQALGAVVVEMEAAGLYAFSEASGCLVLCFAHVTNQMARQAGDFDKGEANGTHLIHALFGELATHWKSRN